MGRRKIDEAKVLRLIQQGKSARSVAKECGVSHNTVIAVAKRNKVQTSYSAEHLTARSIEHRHQTITKLVNDGLSCTEIAKRTGWDRSNIRKTCVKLGLSTNPKKDYDTNLKKAISRIEERGFVYIGGYENAHSRIVVRKKECGHTFEKPFSSFYSDKPRESKCPVCEEANREAKQKKEYKPNWKRIEGAQTKIVVCRTCGVPFVATRNGRVYCSNSCGVKSREKTHELVRRKRITSNSEPDSITLRALFEKDNGRCWICGGVCNYEDCHRNDNGAFIAGDKYPSIDHVIPLSKGGTHKWNNVRLAHRSCNTKRGNRYPPFGMVTTARL